MHSHGYGVYQSIIYGYTAPESQIYDVGTQNLSENNSKSMHAIMEGLARSKFTKVMHCGSTNEIWDKFQNTHEGNDKVKKEKIQAHRGQFENLKMREYEDIAT
jgi:hypothetical protein